MKNIKKNETENPKADKNESPRKNKELKLDNTKSNRWWIAAMGTLLHLCMGTVYAWSYFQNPISETYQWTNSQTAWVFSISIFMLGIGAMRGGTLLPKWGPKKLALLGGILYALGYLIAALAFTLKSIVLLYLGFGFMGGFGMGIAYVTPIATVSNWFPDKQGLVTGMVIMGFGLGAVLMSKVLAPMYAQIADNSIPLIFLYIGITLLVIILFAASFLKMPINKKEVASKTPGQTKINLPKGLFTSKLFLSTWVIFACIIVAGMLFLSFQSPLLQDKMRAKSPDKSIDDLASAGATLIAISSMFNGLGRIVWGGISDRMGRIQSFRGITLILTLIFAVLLVVKNPFWFSVLVCIVLLCYGGGAGVMPSFIKERFGAINMPRVYGAMLTAWGVGGIVGSQIVAYAKDNFLPHDAAFYSFCIALVLLLIALVLTLLIKKKHIPNQYFAE